MSHIAYINGQYLPHAYARTHIEDRGYQFADGVYEYIAFYNGKTLDEAPHLARLKRSLAEIEIDAGHTIEALPFILREIISQNHRRDGALYIQISRATAKRDHPFPKHANANLVVTLRGSKMPDLATAKQGIKVITQPDQRWGRCDIKSISLLANVLAKQQAIETGAKEAWLFKPDGMITEGAVSNAFLVKAGTIYTHPKTNAILGGITRETVLQLAKKHHIPLEEKAFNLCDIPKAEEAFLTSTSSNVQPVIQVDDTTVGNGKLGPISAKLMEGFAKHIYKQTGKQW